MAKKDWKKHFLRMKQLANQNLGRCVKTIVFMNAAGRRSVDTAAAAADKQNECVFSLSQTALERSCLVLSRLFSTFERIPPPFYSHNAMLALVLAVIMCPSVCPSVCHTPVLCQNG